MLRTEPSQEKSQNSTASARAQNSLEQRTPRTSNTATREDLRDLSQAQPLAGQNDLITRGVGIAADTAKEAGAASMKIGQFSISGLRDLFLQGSQNSNIKKSFLAVIASVFGLKGIKEALTVPKLLGDAKLKTASSPLIFKAAKILAGSSIAFGLFKTILGQGSGLGASGLIVGIASYMGLSFLTNLYENSESRSGKISNFLGLRNKLVDVMKIFKFNAVIDED